MGVGGQKKIFPKFNQICCVSYLHECHKHQHNILGPGPLGPWGGAKRSNIIKSELHSQFQRFLNQILCIFSQMKDIITYQTGFSFSCLGHAQGWDLGILWGVGGSFCFQKFNQIWRLSYLHERHMHRQKFLGPHPLGPWEGVKNLIF